jgi:ABC-type Fe3+-siderophore transport system permease subunit
MRAAFFNIVRLYPDEVLATLFYYKPTWIEKSILQDLTVNQGAYPQILKVLLIAAFVNFVGFLVTPASFSKGSIMLRLNGLGALFGISFIPSYLVAWAVPHTTADLLFYCLFCIGLGLSAVMQLMRAAVRHTFAARATA